MDVANDNIDCATKNLFFNLKMYQQTILLGFSASLLSSLVLSLPLSLLFLRSFKGILSSTVWLVPQLPDTRSINVPIASKAMMMLHNTLDKQLIN